MRYGELYHYHLGFIEPSLCDTDATMVTLGNEDMRMGSP